MSSTTCVRYFFNKSIACHNLRLGVFFNGAFRARSFSSSVNEENVLAPEVVLDIPDITLHKCLFDVIEKYADKTFLVNGEDGSSYTFSEAREKSYRFSSALARLGVAKGDVVAIVSPNCPEYFVGVFGTIILGAIVTPVSPHFTKDEIARQLNDSESSVVICHKDCFKEVNEALKAVRTFRHLILIGKEHDGAFSLHKLLKDDGKGIPSHVESNASGDIAILPYSSGTTGLPKGVMLTHANLVSNAYQGAYGDVLPLSEDTDDTIIAVLPFYHIYGFYVGFLISCMFGAKTITMKKYDTASFVHLIHSYKATSLQTVPPMVSALCNDKVATPEKLASLQSISCAAAPVGPALHERFLNKFGPSIKFFEGYGMTELSPACNFSREDYVPGACGPPIPNTYIKIIHLETGDSLAPGAEGELCVKGPQVMKGYWNNPEATKKMVTEDGWLHTGDIAKMDTKGNIYIIDRLKELIKVKGLQVAPAELEDLLRMHPSIEDVAVIGIPDEKAGEVPKAFIIPAKGHSPSEEELVRFVEGKVAPYKRLKGGVVMVEEIPKSASGKILRRLLKERHT